MSKETLVQTFVTLGILSGLATCATEKSADSAAVVRALANGPTPIVEPPPRGLYSVPLPIVESSILSQGEIPTATATEVPHPQVTAEPNKTQVSQSLPESDLSQEARDLRRLSQPEAPVKLLNPKEFTDLLLNPGAGVVSRTHFFTSACFGPNPLQKEDFLQPGDWWGSKRDIGRDNTCEFGYQPDVSGKPTGRYNVGKFNGLPLYYIVPPEAFANRTAAGKLILPEASLIVDPEPWGGWESLGYLYIKADDTVYWGWAADVLRPAGILRSFDGKKTIVMPTNDHNIFKPQDNGGNYGFANFPMIVADRELAFAITGSPTKGPPPRIYFGIRVNELDPAVNAKTTFQMTNAELSEVASLYDRRLTGVDRAAELAKLEKDAPVNYPEIGIKPKEEAVFEFSPEPGQILSSVYIWMWPNNPNNQGVLEMNPDIYVNGELFYPGTGFEDLGGNAFYNGGTNPLGGFFPIDHGGYLAFRYFLGPVVKDGKIVVRLRNPDVGNAVRLRVAVKVFEADPTWLNKIGVPVSGK